MMHTTPVPDLRNTPYLSLPEQAIPWLLIQRLFQQPSLNERGTRLLHVAPDAEAMMRLQKVLEVIAPTIPCHIFPEWDTFPYDHASPSILIQGARTRTLQALSAGNPQTDLIVLTTLPSLLQRVLPPHTEEIASGHLAVGQEIQRDQLSHLLLGYGFCKVTTVREPGEYAFRGNIIDLFLPGSLHASQVKAIRLDLFGDTIESIRTLDPLTQRSTTPIQSCSLTPFKELLLTPERIQSFRRQYRQLFGAEAVHDQRYQDITNNILPRGGEQWLPLFFDTPLSTLLSYFSGTNDLISLYDGWEKQAADIGDQIQAHYESRTAPVSKKITSSTQTLIAPYRPVPPALMYAELATLHEALPPSTLTIGTFQRQDTPALGFKNHLPFPLQKTAQALDTLDAMMRESQNQQPTTTTAMGSTHPFILCSHTPGRAHTLQRLFKERSDITIPLLTPDVFFQPPSKEATPLPALSVMVLPLAQGFIAPNYTVIADTPFISAPVLSPQKRRARTQNFIAEVSGLMPDDLIVHEEHGVGQFKGLVPLTIEGVLRDFMELFYADGDKLYLPVENLELLTRYGSADTLAPLDQLGAKSWQRRKAKAKGRIKIAAASLMKLAARRATKQAPMFSLCDQEYEAFVNGFPFTETGDQARAIDDVLADLSKGIPMDRLICGDVGFGKTEVALRAAFTVAAGGKQVALIVPTTLLCRQHSRTFTARFKDTGLTLATLSRLTPPADVQAIKVDMAAGKIDILIGTHSLFSESVAYHNLGLVIIDEEQHFGVGQKEKLKNLCHNVHMLTMTATPIPRTLQLSLSGVREMSLITTPPVDRHAIHTFVGPLDPLMLKEALLREHHRQGQSFVVCPRVSDIAIMAKKLSTLVPTLRVLIAHGQMSSTALDDVMNAFENREADILLATNIIESGIDISTANTLIVHRSNLFGLGQLYQIRGRIGRSQTRGYAYLTWPETEKLTTHATKRLDVMQTLDRLGAGFQLASYDMDIRGAGNIVGDEQSGHIKEVGVELYQHMLQEAIDELRADARLQGNTAVKAEMDLRGKDWSPQLNLGVSYIIPETYLKDPEVRISFYRRLAKAEAQDEIPPIIEELVDRFGPLPIAVEKLLQVIHLKILCRRAHVSNLDVGSKGILVTFHENCFPGVTKLMGYVQQESGAVKVRPDQKLFVSANLKMPEKRLARCHTLLEKLISFL